MSRQEENLKLIQEVDQALNERDPKTKRAKLATWEAKVSQRENIWDRLKKK